MFICSRSECKINGFTVLLLAENEADYKILEILDRSLCLISNSINVQQFVVWTPGLKCRKETKNLNSRIKVSFENNKYMLLN